jgi:CheY-like chemotaxis protein
MDLHQILSLLRSEKEKIDRVIASLEELQAITSQVAGPRRRKRTPTNQEDRSEVSARMKRFAERRKGITRPVAGKNHRPDVMGFRLLIVEDETAIRKMLTVVFTNAGYEVLSATHAPDAMKLLAIERVDAVLSDVLLNSLSGHDLARWVAEHHPSVPCVLMTGFDDRDCENCPFASGCIQLRKPFNPKDAVTVVGQAIGGE